MLNKLKEHRAWGVVLKDCKKPRSPHDFSLLDSSDPSTWHDFETCYNKVIVGEAAYVCFCFSEHDPFCFVDVDGIEKKWTNDKFLNHLKFFNTYAEISRSGNGVHFIGYGKKPENAWCKRDEYEVYDNNHWLTLTFKVLNDETGKKFDSLGNIETQVAKLIAKKAYKPRERTENGILNMNTGAILRALRKREITNSLLNGEDVYGDESRNDYALMGAIGYYTNYDKVRMKEIFELTERGQREKWKTRADYQELTINKIIGG